MVLKISAQTPYAKNWELNEFVKNNSNEHVKFKIS